jgi:hypothetical protein
LDRISFLETIVNHEAEVVEKTKKLIDLTIKKFQDIVVMRGMIMHETSSLDMQKVEILKKYIKSKNSLETKGLKDKILKEIKSFVDEKCNKYQDLFVDFLMIQITNKFIFMIAQNRFNIVGL